MKFIIDTNILLAALIKDSTTRKIIVKSGWEFYYPELSFHEVRKYKDLVLAKSGVSDEEYTQLLNLLLKYIILVPEEKIYQHADKAGEIMRKIDKDDVVFIAAALGMDSMRVWSD